MTSSPVRVSPDASSLESDVEPLTWAMVEHARANDTLEHLALDRRLENDRPLDRRLPCARTTS